MAHRARTIKAGLALAYGKSSYNTKGRGFDLEHINRRNRIEVELNQQGLQMCWQCEKGFNKALDTCPHCQTPIIPF